jgi:hypothetical protein
VLCCLTEEVCEQNIATSEESMDNNVVQHGALLRVGCEDLLHKLACIE